MPTNLLADFLIWYAVFVFSTTCHEFAHALVAYRGGDATAQAHGTLSMDPLPHLRRSPFGMIIAPAVSFLFLLHGAWMIGWASVPYDPSWARRYPRRAAAMSFAGPLTNLLIAAFAFGVIKLGLHYEAFAFPRAFEGRSWLATLVVGAPEAAPWLKGVAMVASVSLSLNVILGIFNLIPVPPLDGAGVLEGLAPRSLGRLYGYARETPIVGFLGLLVAWKVAGYLIDPVMDLVFLLLRA